MTTPCGANRPYVDGSRFDIWSIPGAFYGGDPRSNSTPSCSHGDIVNRILLTPHHRRVYLPLEVSECLHCAQHARMWGPCPKTPRDALVACAALHGAPLEASEPTLVVWPIGHRISETERYCVGWIVATHERGQCTWRHTCVADAHDTPETLASIHLLIASCEAALGPESDACLCERRHHPRAWVWTSLIATLCHLALVDWQTPMEPVMVCDDSMHAHVCDYAVRSVAALMHDPSAYLQYGYMPLGTDRHSLAPTHQTAVECHSPAFLATRVPFSNATLKYHAWDAAPVYCGFQPYESTLNPAYDFFSNVSIEKPPWWNAESLECRVRDSDVRNAGWRTFRVANCMHPPPFVDDPWVRFAFAGCECADMPHHTRLEKGSDGVRPSVPKGLFGTERAILMRSLEFLCDARPGMASARAVDALKRGEWTIDQQRELVLKCFNVTCIDVSMCSASEEERGSAVVLFTVTPDGHCVRVGDESGIRYTSVLDLAISYRRRCIFSAVASCAAQPLLVRARLVQVAGLCPVKRMRNELFVFALDSRERAELLNGMFCAFRSGDRRTMSTFCAAHATALMLLFRTAHLHPLRHLAFIQHSLESFKSTRALTNVFYQMSFSFVYETDAVAWEPPSTLAVTWVRDAYRMRISCNTLDRTAFLDVFLASGDSYYVRSAYGEFVKVRDDTVRLVFECENGTTIAACEPSSIFDLDMPGEAPWAPLVRDNRAHAHAAVECVDVRLVVMQAGHYARIDISPFIDNLAKLTVAHSSHGVFGYISV